MHFAKLQSLGNDFIIIESAKIPFALSKEFIQKLCHRNFGIGADGLIVYNYIDDHTVKMEFFNCDGTHANLCGNGLRCLFYLTKAKQVLTSCQSFEGIVDGNTVTTFMPIPNFKGQFKIYFENSSLNCQWVNSGVEHLVVNGYDSSLELAKYLRYHEFFMPVGVNVNFLNVKDGKNYLRTFEKGVEDFTLACGTGALATFSLMNKDKERIYFSDDNFCDLKKEDNFIKIEAKVNKIYEAVVDQTFLS